MGIEDGQELAETAPEATADGSQGYSDLLKGDGTTPTQDGPGSEKPFMPENQEGAEKPKTEGTDQATVEEILVEINGKQFTGKADVIEKALAIATALGPEGLDALSNAQKLVDLKKGYDKAFTQNSQVLAEVRKSFTDTFGRIPEPQEFQALGKLWQGYFSNPQYKQAMDAMLQGLDLSSIAAGQPGQPQPNQNQPPANAEILRLQRENAEIKEYLSRFANQFQTREQARVAQESKSIWDAWVGKMKTQGVDVSEDINAKMAPFFRALAQANPEWDDHRILDEAYRHATIGDSDKRIVSQVLANADRAKKTSPPTMTPRVGTKPESEMSYSDIIRSHAK